MKAPGIALFVIACMMAGPAGAGMALAEKKNCMSCHAIDHKVIGPAFRDVATRYAGQPDAVTRLSEKVIRGGTGVWGTAVMSANPQVNEAEARRLVLWILSLK
jgi:cytochrome c